MKRCENFCHSAKLLDRVEFSVIINMLLKSSPNSIITRIFLSETSLGVDGELMHL